MSAPVVPLPPVRALRPAADKRAAGGSAERALLRPVHIGAAHGAEGHNAHQKYNNGKFLHQHTTPRDTLTFYRPEP